MSSREIKYTRRFRELERQDHCTDRKALWQRAKDEVNASEDAADAANLRVLRESELWPHVEATQAAMVTALQVESDKNQTVEEMEKQVPASRRAIGIALNAYTQARRDLFGRKLREADLSFCTRCKRVKPTTDVELAAVKARVMHSDSDCSYNQWSWMEDHLDIHMMCTMCREQAVKPPEQVSSDGISGSTYSMLIPAKVEGEHYLVNQGGRWEELPKEGRNFVTRERDYRDELYFEFGLPCELGIFMDKLYLRESWRDSVLVFDPEAL